MEEEYGEMIDMGFVFDKLSDGSLININPIVPYVTEDIVNDKVSIHEHCSLIFCIAEMTRSHKDQGIVIARRILSEDVTINFLSGFVMYMRSHGKIVVEDYSNDFGRVTISSNELETILYMFITGEERKSTNKVYITALKERCRVNKKRVHEVNHLDKVYIGESSVSVFFRK